MKVHMTDEHNGWVTEDDGTPMYKIVPKWVTELMKMVIEEKPAPKKRAKRQTTSNPNGQSD
jgi:hypothetical protein